MTLETRTKVAICGSTGSIGTQAIDVVEANPERFQVTAIGANSSVDALAEQAARLMPEVVAIADEAKAPLLAAMLPPGVELRSGPGSLASLAQEADVVLNAVVGFAGLPVTLEALRRGRRSRGDRVAAQGVQYRRKRPGPRTSKARAFL